MNVNCETFNLASLVSELDTNNTTSVIGATSNTTETLAVFPFSEVIESEVVTVIPWGIWVKTTSLFWVDSKVRSIGSDQVPYSIKHPLILECVFGKSFQPLVIVFVAPLYFVTI